MSVVHTRNKWLIAVKQNSQEYLAPKLMHTYEDKRANKTQGNHQTYPSSTMHTLAVQSHHANADYPIMHALPHDVDQISSKAEAATNNKRNLKNKKRKISDEIKRTDFILTATQSLLTNCSIIQTIHNTAKNVHVQIKVKFTYRLCISKTRCRQNISLDMTG